MPVVTCIICGIDFPTSKQKWQRNSQHFCSRFCWTYWNANRPFKERSLPIERFLVKVIYPKSVEDCWIWGGAITSQGYGHFEVRGKLTKAHRFSYEWVYGTIPSGLHILHTCDVRPCVNPFHLRAGTQQENIQDAVCKGRVPGRWLTRNSSQP